MTTQLTDTQARILEAATVVIAQSGIRGLRVNDIAKQAAVSPGLLYYHFTDRAGLLAATLDYINTRAGEFSVDATSFRDLLLDEIMDNPEIRKNSVAWNELRSTAVFEPDVALALKRTTAQWNATIAAAIARSTELGPDTDVDQLAEVLTILVEGLSSRWLSGSLTTERARHLLTSTVDILIASPPLKENS